MRSFIERYMNDRRILSKVYESMLCWSFNNKATRAMTVCLGNLSANYNVYEGPAPFLGHIATETKEEVVT